MATRIIWSPEAADDLEEITNYIARDSDRYAAEVAARILDGVEKLADFPRIGRIVPELEDESVREIIVYHYRVVYRIYLDAVQIARIIHGARDLLSIIGKDNV